MKVKIKSWTAVATWRWVANDDHCGICRMPFDSCCPDCKLPGDDCPLVWGQCSHCFHIHCIVKWLNSQQVHQPCPMCRQEWKFKEWMTKRHFSVSVQDSWHFRFTVACESGASAGTILFRGVCVMHMHLHMNCVGVYIRSNEKMKSLIF